MQVLKLGIEKRDLDKAEERGVLKQIENIQQQYVVAGFVYEGATNKPLKNVKVLISNGSTNKVEVSTPVLTDSTGFFGYISPFKKVHFIVISGAPYFSQGLVLRLR